MSRLVHYGRSVIRSRRDFIEEMNGIIREIHSNITGGKEEIQLIYEPSILEDDFLSALAQNQEETAVLKMTSTGPHRDDMGGED